MADQCLGSGVLRVAARLRVGVAYFFPTPCHKSTIINKMRPHFGLVICAVYVWCVVCGVWRVACGVWRVGVWGCGVVWCVACACFVLVCFLGLLVCVFVLCVWCRGKFVQR
jgi:hypothetical protein